MELEEIIELSALLNVSPACADGTSSQNLNFERQQQ